MNKHREKEIPQEKKERVKRLAEKLKQSNSIVLVSIKNVPAKQLQVISKKLRGKAEIKVYKNSIATRAIDKVSGKVKDLKKHLQANIAFLFSDLDPFELAAILTKNKSRARAKEGQEVNEDVVVRAGPTEMTPGPIISELGDLGIQFEIKEGKINIKENKTLLKKGEVASEGEVSIMTKLDLKPVEVKLKPLVAYDSKDDKIFEEIEVDSEKVAEDIQSRYSKAIALAVSIGYVCKETISHLLRKAASHEKALNKKVKSDGGETESGESEDKSEEAEGEEEGKTEEKSDQGSSEGEKGEKQSKETEEKNKGGEKEEKDKNEEGESEEGKNQTQQNKSKEDK